MVAFNMNNERITLPFRLGQIAITQGAMQELLERNLHPFTFLARHARCDWGNVSKNDKAANDAALIEGSRILSAYEAEDFRIWIITEADRSSTVILLPEEY